MREEEYLQDDYVVDKKKIIYLVISNSHPPQKVLISPKYLPQRRGKWQGKYKRLFSRYTSAEYHKNLKNRRFRKLQYWSNHFSKYLMALPQKDIKQHLIPEFKLKTILEVKKKELDTLEFNNRELSEILLEY